MLYHCGARPAQTAAWRIRQITALTPATWLIVLLLTCGLPAAQAAIEPVGGLNDTLLHQLLLQDPVEHIQRLGNISDVEGALVRTFLSPAHMRAASLIRRWMREAGMLTWQDAVGNVHGRVDGPEADAPALLIGSHYDTVYDAGQYDGAMGIIVGIAAVKAAMLGAALQRGMISEAQLPSLMADGANLHQVLQESGAPPLLRAPVEVIAFCDEEGLRFGTTFLGSRAVAGTLLSNGMLEAVDREGKSLAEVLAVHGFDAAPVAISRIATPRERIRGYVEVHMEQGPVLESLNLPLAPVTAIAGQTRLAVSIAGSQGHAGTVPMTLRRDPLAAAAEAIATLERRCGGGRHADVNLQGFSAEDGLVCTVGSLTIWPGASNVIPGSANFTVDIRSRSDAVREAVVADVTSSISATCDRRGTSCRVDRVHDAPATHSDAGITAGLSAAAAGSKPLLRRVLGVAGVSEQQQSPPQQQQQQQRRQEAGLGSVAAPGRALPQQQQSSGGSSCAAGGGPAGDAASSCPATEAAPRSAAPTAGPGGGADAAAAPEQNSDSHPGVPQLVSGAGHDALAMADAGPVGMLFVRCRNGGISHSPAELVDDEDVAAAAAALLTYLHAEVA